MAIEGIRKRISGEGTGYWPSGATSLSQIDTLDLISEGEIEGLASGDYPASGVSGVAGEVGWRIRNFVSYNTPVGSGQYAFLRSIYWNEVPILSSDGKFNFQKVDVQYTKGTPNGDLLGDNSGELTVSRTIGERLRGTVLNFAGEAFDSTQDYTKYYRIFNKECKSVIVNVKVPTLSETVQTGPNIGKSKVTSVQYKIYYKPLYSSIGKGNTNSQFPPVEETIEGQSSYGYVRSTRISFPGGPVTEKDFLGWEIKIVRLTPDSTNSFVRNQTYIDSLTEIYSNSFLYPNSAIVRSKFDAEFFQRVPSRAFDTLLLKVKIPSNYDPILKNYDESSGGWDGTFADDKQWTDNPVWCFYDMVSNRRYGLGKYIPEDSIDKWTLYKIAKYCDTLVPDGFGNLEPRFTCNLIINSREEAFKVISDMASIFRAINYYSQGTIFTSQDSEKDPIVLFNNANVEDGNFNYSSSSKRTRHTVVIVRYNDPQNFYKPAIEYVEDVDGIRRYGIRQTEISAFGCTSRGQAVRLGRWLLLSEILETETISFTAGLEANYLRPGDIFKVYDVNRKSQRSAGRLAKCDLWPTSGTFLLDSEVPLVSGGLYDLSVLTPTYYYDTTQITDLNSNDFSGIRKPQFQKFTFTGYWQSTGISGRTSINITATNSIFTGFDSGQYSFAGQLPWMIELSSGAQSLSDSNYTFDSGTDLYRVIRIAEKDINKYEIGALQYNPDKYVKIESGLAFQRTSAQINYIPTSPTLLSLAVDEKSLNTKIISYSFTVDNYTGITSFKTYAKTGLFNSSLPEDVYLISTLPAERNYDTFLPGISGRYYFRTYSYNGLANIFSTGFASGDVFVRDINPIRDIIISSLRIQGDTGVYPDQRNLVPIVVTNEISPIFTWQAGLQDDGNIPTNLMFRATVRPVSTAGFPATSAYYQESGIKTDESGLYFSFDFNKNLSLNNFFGTAPYRTYDVVVEAHDEFGNTSVGQMITSTSNIGITTENTGLWVQNNDAYQRLTYLNPRPSGIELTSGWKNHPNFITIQGYNTNGDIFVNYVSGDIDDDIVGGYLFAFSGFYNKPNERRWFTTGPFPSQGQAFEALDVGLNPSWTGIRVSEFSFDQNTKTLTAHNVLKMPEGKVSGYMAISFYDAFDKAQRDNNQAIDATYYWRFSALNPHPIFISTGVPIGP